jgi:hypothetical protein
LPEACLSVSVFSVTQTALCVFSAHITSVGAPIMTGILCTSEDLQISPELK